MGRRGRCGELGQEESPRCPSLPRLPAAPHPGAERASVPARPGQARPPPLAPRCPDPPCSERGWLLASPRSSGERGRGLLPFRPSREQGPRFFLESPWAGPFVGSGAQACVFSGVGGGPESDCPRPGDARSWAARRWDERRRFAATCHSLGNTPAARLFVLASVGTWDPSHSGVDSFQKRAGCLFHNAVL